MFGRKKIELLDDERAQIETLPEPMRQVLAVGRGNRATMIALPEVCCVRNADHWEIFGWHEVQNGRWDDETQQMIWTLVTGESGSAELNQPAELPRIFTERVNDTIVVQRMLRVPDTSFTVVIVARRALRKKAALVWTVQALGSTNLADPRVEQFVLEMTEHLKEEFESDAIRRRSLFAL